MLRVGNVDRTQRGWVVSLCSVIRGPRRADLKVGGAELPLMALGWELPDVPSRTCEDDSGSPLSCVQSASAGFPHVVQHHTRHGGCVPMGSIWREARQTAWHAGDLGVEVTRYLSSHAQMSIQVQWGGNVDPMAPWGSGKAPGEDICHSLSHGNPVLIAYHLCLQTPLL